MLPALVTVALVTGALLAVLLLDVLVAVAVTGRKAGSKKLLSDALETLAVAATEVSVVAGFRGGGGRPEGGYQRGREGTAAR